MAHLMLAGQQRGKQAHYSRIREGTGPFRVPVVLREAAQPFPTVLEDPVVEPGEDVPEDEHRQDANPQLKGRCGSVSAHREPVAPEVAFNDPAPEDAGDDLQVVLVHVQHRDATGRGPETEMPVVLMSDTMTNSD